MTSPESENKEAGVHTSQVVTAPNPEADTLPEHPSLGLRRPIWLVRLTIVVVVALILWGGGVLSSTNSQSNPTQIISIAASTATPTDIPVSAPTSTSTNTPLPPTHTPSPSSTPTPTNTVVSPTATPLIIVVTATPTFTPIVQPTSTASTPTAAPTAIVTTPTPNLPNGEFALLNPLSLDEPSYGPTDFEWEWGGPVPPDFGFEVRVWREGEPHAGVHDAVLDNQQGRIEQIGENRYRLSVNIRQAFGVQERTGEYLWTVALVQISPEYADLSQQAKPSRLRFEAGGSSGGGNDTDSSNSGFGAID